MLTKKRRRKTYDRHSLRTMDPGRFDRFYEVHVVSVTVQAGAGGHLVTWQFNRPVSTDGGDVPQFAIDTPDGPEAPVETWQGVGPGAQMQIVANYENGECAAGQAWHLTAAPRGIDLGPGGVISAPQNGTTA